MPETTGLTTEISIPADNAILTDLLRGRYSRMELGEVRAELEARYGKVFDETELRRQYDVDRHESPYVHVVSKTDGARCTLAYTETPRFYFLLQCEDANE